MTRAKAAQLNVDELSQPSKPLQSKKSAVNTNPQAGRKRAALGDLNVNKSDVSDVKKPVASGKLGLVSKAAPPSRVQKSSSTATSSRRAAVAPKEPVKKQLKRSGPGDIAARRAEAASAPAPSVAKENTPAEEREPVRKKVHTLEKVRKVAVEEEVITKTVTTEPEPEDSVTLGAEAAEDTVDEYPPGVKNLDEEDLDDPLMVAEYATEIFKYLGELECKSLANPDYMSHQDDLEWKTRGILIDWLVEVHTRFHLLPETLFLAINIIDRFLTEKIVQLDRLQLVGVTAMFIASKYEEVLSPHVGNFRHVADDGFTEAEILSAERFILSTLNYNLSYPNPMNFLRRISKADNYDIQSRTIGKYLMEISLLDHRFMEYRPSHVAAGAMFLARRILDRGEWVSHTHLPS